MSVADGVRRGHRSLPMAQATDALFSNMKQRLGHPVLHMDVRMPRERRIACSGPLALWRTRKGVTFPVRSSPLGMSTSLCLGGARLAQFHPSGSRAARWKTNMKQRLGHPVLHMDGRMPRERRIACSSPLALWRTRKGVTFPLRSSPLGMSTSLWLGGARLAQFHSSGRAQRDGKLGCYVIERT
jgi:hypothetical protein